MVWGRNGMAFLLKNWADNGKSDENRKWLAGGAFVAQMSRPPMSTTTLPAAVFIDRDGTLMEEAHYCGDSNT